MLQRRHCSLLLVLLLATAAAHAAGGGSRTGARSGGGRAVIASAVKAGVVSPALAAGGAAGGAAYFASDFTLGLSQPSAIITAPGAAVLTVTVTFLSGFSDRIVFSCSGVPTNAACIFSPTSIPATFAPATSTLAINTALATAQNRKQPGGNGSTVLFAGLGLAGLLSAFALRGRRLRRVSMLCALSGFCAVFTACGNGMPQTSFPVTPGTYNIVVTGTGTTGGVAHSANFALTVIPQVPF